MRFTHYLIILTCILSISCSKDEPIETTGTIYGRITEDVSNEAIVAAQVSISDIQQSVSTGQDGIYQFSDITAGSYSITASKSGYLTDVKNITVVAGETTNGDFSLQKLLPIANPNSLTLNNEINEVTLELENTRATEMYFSIETSSTSLSVFPVSSSIEPFNTKLIDVSVDFSGLAVGDYQESLIINVDGASLTIPVEINYQGASPPIVEINVPTEITTTSITISGEITSLGVFASQVDSYGHVYSTSNTNPTINDSKTEYGPTVDPLSYESVIENLDHSTTYYIAAYATNPVGTAYSDVVEVTTEEPEGPQIGDYHQGGIVFYIFQQGDEDYVAGEHHGLIAAEEDLTQNIDWCGGCDGGTGFTQTNATYEEVGSGDTNTQMIIESQGSGVNGENYYAASICNDLVLNDYDDWFLPAKNTLWEMKNNIGPGDALGLGNIGNFDNTGGNSNYWSSTESEQFLELAWNLEFYEWSDSMGEASKWNDHINVRAIRKF